jgi:hypothetical protein
MFTSRSLVVVLVIAGLSAMTNMVMGTIVPNAECKSTNCVAASEPCDSSAPGCSSCYMVRPPTSYYCVYKQDPNCNGGTTSACGKIRDGQCVNGICSGGVITSENCYVVTCPASG